MLVVEDAARGVVDRMVVGVDVIGVDVDMMVVVVGVGGSNGLLGMPAYIFIC